MRPQTQSAVVRNDAAATMHTLIVGDVRRWAAVGRDTADFGDFQYTSFSSLTRDVLDKTDPQMVLSPLMTNDFDAIDLARHLHELGYTGCYRVIAPNTAHADIIRADVAAVAPNIDFDIFEVPMID